MASTLTDAGELTYVSFGIEKVESTPDGDLMCYGRASDGSLDHDLQIVDPQFSSKAIRDWLESGGNVRVQHNPQRDPAGVGLEVNTDEHGATWVKSLIVEDGAKKLLLAGALRAYSVGIARPTIVRDAVAKGGRITDGSICEISLVDRPSNARCGVTLVKSADDGTPEYVGKVFGADDAIAKALNGDVTEKSQAADMAEFQMPEDLSVTFTPGDLAKLFKGKIIEQHYDDLAIKAVIDAEAAVYKRDIDTATRRRLRAEGKALPNLSYPIENAGDLQNAASLARSGHGDVAAARKLIARRAKELGVANPLDDSDSTSKGTVTETAEKSEAGLTALPLAPAEPSQAPLTPVLTPLAAKEAEPDVVKDPEQPPAEPKDRPVKKAKKQPKGKKKLPPWLNKPDDGSDDDKGSSGDDGACKSVTDHLWTGTEGTSNIYCSKCHTTPAEAAGLSGTHDMTCAPVPELLESPPMASTKGSPTPQSASGAAEAPAMTPVPQHREPDGAIVEPFEKDAGLPATGQGETPTRLEAGMMKSSPRGRGDPAVPAPPASTPNSAGSTT